MTWEAPQDPFERYQREVTPESVGAAAVSHVVNHEVIAELDNSLFDAGMAYLEQVGTIKDTFRGAEPALQLAVPEVSKLRADRERLHGAITRKGVDEIVWRELEANHMWPIDATPAYKQRLLDAKAACQAHGVGVDAVIAPLVQARNIMTGPLRPTDENSVIPFQGEFENYTVEPRKILRGAMVVSQFDPDSLRTAQEHVRLTRILDSGETILIDTTVAALDTAVLFGFFDDTLTSPTDSPEATLLDKLIAFSEPED